MEKKTLQAVKSLDKDEKKALFDALGFEKPIEELTDEDIDEAYDELTDKEIELSENGDESPEAIAVYGAVTKLGNVLCPTDEDEDEE